MWNLLGGAVGALGSIYGAQQQAAATNQANVFNYDLGVQNMQNQVAQNAQNRNDQYAFAQGSAGWRLSDIVGTARRVGINPLAALGVQGSSYTNQMAPENMAQMQAPQVGNLYSQAGQSLGRAIAAVQSPEDRAATALNLEHAQLQNDYLRAQINQLKAPGLAAGVPSIDNKVPDTVPGQPGTVWGRTSDVQLVDTPGGGTAVVPPKEISQLGFFHPASLSWYARNGLLPVGDSNVPAGQEGKYYNPFTMTYSNSPGYADQAWETAKRWYKNYNDFFGRAW